MKVIKDDATFFRQS